MCRTGGKDVKRTAQDVEESTKHVNVEGKREALLASSAAAEEATKVSAVAASETGDFHSAFDRATPARFACDFSLTKRLYCVGGKSAGRQVSQPQRPAS